MKTILSSCICMALFAGLASCATTSFPAPERWEGWAVDRVRIYVQYRQAEAAVGADESAGEPESPGDPAFVRMATERAAFLAAQYRAAAGPGAPEKAYPEIDPASGRVVHKSCDEDRCEAFVDFSFAGRGQ